MMIVTNQHRFIRNASRFCLSAAVVLLAFFALAGTQSAHAASDERPPGKTEYRQIAKQALQSTMPESLAGMKRVQVIYNPVASIAVYSGGQPLATLGLVVRPSRGGDKFKSSMQEQVKEGTAAILERNGRTMYLTGSAVASSQSGTPAVSVLAGDKIISVKGKPDGDATLDAGLVRTQLLEALESADAERLAGISPASAMLCSASIEISGGVNATLQVTDATLGFLGGFTDTQWSIGLRDASKGMAIRVFYMPTDIEPGTYALHEQPSLMSGHSKSVISAKLQVENFEQDGDAAYWDEDVTGTLTVESVENGRMTGQFEFKAYQDGAPPVQVKGSFEKLVVLDGKLNRVPPSTPGTDSECAQQPPQDALKSSNIKTDKFFDAYQAARYPVYQNDAWGYIDATGRMLIKPRFDEAEFFSDGLARVKVDGTYKFISPKGDVVLTPNVAWVGPFSEGLAVAKPVDGEHFGYIDESGVFVIEPQFMEAYVFSDGLAAVSAGTKPGQAQPAYGYIDSRGSFVIDPQFWNARRFSGGLAPVLVGGFVFGKWGYVNREGQMVVKPQFENALPFSQGLAAVEIDDMSAWGYIDPQGQVVIEPQFRQAHTFASGRAAVETSFSDTYYINRVGDRVFPWEEGEYARATPFHGTLARTSMEMTNAGWGTVGGGPWIFMGKVPHSSWLYVDRQGQQVWPQPKPAGESGIE